MFRKLTRHKQLLSKAECQEILEKALRGVLAVNGEDGYPYALPLNFYYDNESDTIFFHSGKTGYKLDCLRGSDKACFTVCDDGVRNEGEWWLTIKSVVAFGKVKFVTDPTVIEDISKKLSLKFTQDAEYIKTEIEKYAPATLLLALTIEDMQGKRVSEK